MARMTIKGLDEYALQLEKLGAQAPEIAKRAVYEGANVVAGAVRSSLERALQGSEYSTGDLLDSLGVTPIQTDKNGNTNAKIGFDGYDRKGVPNQIKARAMESGTSRQKKNPFMRRAVNSSRRKAVEKMGQVIDQEITKLGV